MRALVLLLLTGACNQVFGVEQTGAYPDADLRPDRDDDGIADVEDECIVPAVDLASDLDMDGVPSSEDRCPLGSSLNEPDGDGDGLYDNCDPFAAAAGDRHLCSMYFGSIELTGSLWKARPGEHIWAISDGYVIGFDGDETTSMIAAERIVPRTGSSTMDFIWGAIPFSDDSVFRVWISAGPTPSPSDVACDVVSSATGTGVTLRGATMVAESTGDPNVGSGIHLMRVQFQPGKAGINIACTIGYQSSVDMDTKVLTATGHFDGELGDQGFAVPLGALLVYNIVTYHSPEQPPLQ